MTPSDTRESSVDSTVTFADRERLGASDARDLALECLATGIDAARPERAIERHCDLDGGVLWIQDAAYDLSEYDEVVVLGGGKAADDLAAALESMLGDRLDGPFDGRFGGVVVTHQRTADPDRIEVREGEHPAPGEGSVSGTAAVLERAEAAGERSLVLAAITGGGSALLCAPAGGLEIDDLRTVTDGLLDAGAAIDEVNVVRRACSRLKGGGLAAAAAPATVAGVLLSDVVGDDPAVIASGPTVPVATDPAAALEVLERHGVDATAVREWLEGVDSQPAPEVSVSNHVVASNRDSVDAARTVAAGRGYEPCVLSTRIEGEAREAGRFHAAVAAEAASTGDPVDPPAVLLSGGETTVRVTGEGTGGPNLEFALAAGLELPPAGVVAAVDTDGSDGSTDAAGAILDRRTVDGAGAAREALAANDSYPFLEDRGALLRTGATGTNVNDLRVLVVGEVDTD